ncbi:MAG: PEP-utilizing enzyme, partial [Candidatus Cryptobacteroides sp.]
DWAVMKSYVEIGCFECEQPPFSMIAPYYNHGFFNMTNMYRASHCLYGCSKESTDIAICGKVLAGMPDIPMKDKNPLVKIKNMVPFMKLVFGGERARKGMEKVVNSIKFNLDDSMEGIYKQIIDNFHYLKEAHYWHYMASYSSGGASAMLSSAIREGYEDDQALSAAVAGCLTQIEDFESANILKMMKELAAKMLEDEPSLAGADATHIGEYFDTRASASVIKARDEFMTRHGYRGILENEMMNLPWRDNRESFNASMRSVLVSLGQGTKIAEKPWEENLEAVLKRFNPRKHKKIRSSVMKARQGVCYREYTKSRIIFVLDQFKQAYRRLAELMIEAGYLPEVDCIYFLTQEEIGKMLNGEKALVKKAIARKRLFPQQRELKFAYSCLGVPQPLKISNTDNGASVLNGTPVSRGVASGIARVVRCESDAAELRDGEIMVTKCTDIGWSPYYNVISGLVTEIGSALSHGVVVAREYALPTVVNVTDAMDLIKTGDRIRIDGNNGTVEIKSKV